MKNILTSILTLSTMMLLISCGKEFDATKEIEPEIKTDPVKEMIEYSINATIEDMESTKASADPIIRVTWTNGDKVSVIDLTNNLVLGILEAESSGSDVVFTGTITKPEKEYTNIGYVYPAIKTESEFPAEISETEETGVNFAEQTINARNIFCASAVDSNPGEDLNNKKIKFTLGNSFLDISMTDLPNSTSISKIYIGEVANALSWEFTSTGINAKATDGKGITITSDLSSSPKGYLMFGLACPPSENSEKGRALSIYSNNKLIKYADLFTASFGANQYIGTVTKCHNLFSVASDKYVEFSPGNLQATLGDNDTPTGWAFAEKQYESILENNCTVEDSSMTLGSKIDLFNWSTDGIGASTEYKPWGINTAPADADGGTSAYAGNFVDWGTNPDLINSLGAGWRTLTMAEWEYLLTQRSRATDLRKYNTTICGKSCLIIAPDNYSGTISGPYNEEDWIKAEKEGFICLPPTGHRCNGPENIGFNSKNFGKYWSSTKLDSDNAFIISFNYLTTSNPFSKDQRSFGNAVRLVRE